MSGFVAVYRELFDHPVFEGDALAIGAWVWLIGRAAWRAEAICAKSGKKREVINLMRGQLSDSERYLAEAWGCTRKKATGLIRMFESHGMLTVNRDHIQQVITICNYDKWQDFKDKEEPQRDLKGAAEGPKNNNLTTDDDHDGWREPETSPLISPWAYELARDIGKICGHDPQFVPPGWHGAPYRVEAWHKRGWDREICLASVRDQIAKKRDGPPSTINYFEKGIAAAHARQGEPLPEIKIAQPQAPEARRAAKTGSLTEATDRIRDALRARTGASGLRFGAGEDAVRAIPKIGCK